MNLILEKLKLLEDTRETDLLAHFLEFFKETTTVMSA